MKTISSINHLTAPLIMALAVSSNSVRASVPAGPPVFSAPLQITNTWHPFQAGGIKVFAGSKDGQRAVTVDYYLTETRAFVLNGVTVQCHVLREMSLEDGELAEIADKYFAQADNGAVYCFGERVDTYDNGAVTNHDGSWLVGGPTLPSDPPATAAAAAPSLSMPANPERGDVFKSEDLFPIVDETDQVIATGRTVSLPGHLYGSGIVLRETTQLDATSREDKTYAAGVGVLSSRARGESLRLLASSLLPPH